MESIAGAHEGVRILRLSGPFTLRGVFEFQALVRSLKDPVLLIDLTGVPYMDSASLGSLVAVHASAQRDKRRYALVGVSERILTLFKVCAVEGLLVVRPSIEEAERELIAA